MTNKIIKGPRIIVQFEINGSESDSKLAEMKKIEAEWEQILANFMKEQVELAWKEEKDEIEQAIKENSITEATKVAIQLKEANKDIDLKINKEEVIND